MPVLAWSVWYYLAWRERQAEIAKIRAEGELVWFSEIKPEAEEIGGETATPLVIETMRIKERHRIQWVINKGPKQWMAVRDGFWKALEPPLHFPYDYGTRDPCGFET
ncbi:hypothetical protein Pan216_51050 [Planctomycetes bacterium Pan216]|uniref:Uncharacterized protein n=1 Tax=Kolteria novifilia TaxID=2527975 RepID=A0A518BB55_9BACT|nr:hypothetical protein Pan216_51050 [Planctomycetes bacterium Pan216]